MIKERDAILRDFILNAYSDIRNSNLETNSDYTKQLVDHVNKISNRVKFLYKVSNTEDHTKPQNLSLELIKDILFN